MSAKDYPGLRWTREKAAKAGKKGAFVVVGRNKFDKKTGKQVFKLDENGDETRIPETAKISERKMTGIPKQLVKEPNVIYIGEPYWITGTQSDVEAALANELSPSEVKTAVARRITASNYSTYKLPDGQLLSGHIAELKATKRPKTDVEGLTEITPDMLALMLRAHGKRSIGVNEEGFKRIDKQGKELASASGATSPRRKTLTAMELLKRANECSRKGAYLPMKDEDGNWSNSIKKVPQALNIGKMTSDGKGVKSCYVPRLESANLGRRRARKLVHIDVQLENYPSMYTNIVVNVLNEANLNNYISFLGDLLTDRDVSLIKKAFHNASGRLAVSSPSKNKRLRRSPKRSPKNKSSPKNKKGGNVRYVPSSFGKKEERSSSDSSASSASSVEEEQVQPQRAKSPTRRPTQQPERISTPTRRSGQTPVQQSSGRGRASGQTPVQQPTQSSGQGRASGQTSVPLTERKPRSVRPQQENPDE